MPPLSQKTPFISNVAYDNEERVSSVLAKLRRLTFTISLSPQDDTYISKKRGIIIRYIEEMIICIETYDKSLSLTGVDWLNKLYTQYTAPRAC